MIEDGYIVYCFLFFCVGVLFSIFAIQEFFYMKKGKHLKMLFVCLLYGTTAVALMVISIPELLSLL